MISNIYHEFLNYFKGDFALRGQVLDALCESQKMSEQYNQYISNSSGSSNMFTF